MLLVLLSLAAGAALYAVLVSVAYERARPAVVLAAGAGPDAPSPGVVGARPDGV